MPRYVLLHHVCPTESPRPSHWDFMLEMGDVLRTWVLVELPAEWRQALGMAPTDERDVVSAERIGDHRLDYLEIEGPLSGDRGAVSRNEEGEYTVVAESDDRLEIHLAGKRLRGMAVLSRDAIDGDHWSLGWRAG